MPRFPRSGTKPGSTCFVCWCAPVPAAPAGEIGQHLGVRQNTMSTHLAVLHQAGVVRNRREGRSIRYFADMEGFRGLMGFLLEDCCGGRPELCEPVLDEISCLC